MQFDTIKTNKKPKPIVLIILDGWGISPSWGGNAVAMGNHKNINNYMRNYKHTVLKAFDGDVDSKGAMANSEIGHASIGCGRMIDSDIDEINKSISDKTFYQNHVVNECCENVTKNKSNLHLIGLISDGGVHSDIKHLFALLEIAKANNINNVYIHCITDGRDVEPKTALKYIKLIEEKLKEIGTGKIASICGRFYAMDRDTNWKRVEKAYRAQALGIGRREKSALTAVSNLYKDGYTDEMMIPTVVCDKTPIKIKNKDSIIYFNTRADRARELTRAYLDRKIFSGMFTRKYNLLDIEFLTFTDYNLKLSNINIIFKNVKIDSNLAKILSSHGLRQLHVAESEKYAHVTYFFNGGYESPFANEDRIIINSPKVTSYDSKPEMSAHELTDAVLKKIKSNYYDFIVINYANVDMVGHTGNIIAASEAVSIVDKNVSRIVKEVLNHNGIAIITSDHGNAEEMIPLKSMSLDQETLHSINPVPFILISNSTLKDLFKSAYKSSDLQLSDIIKTENSLADIAPTILELLGISKPSDMTGKSLLNKIN